MRVTAQFSDGLRRQLDGMAIGDEFNITARARIIAAEEALVDVTSAGDQDPRYLQGDLEVTLLISRGEVTREDREGDTGHWPGEAGLRADGQLL